MMQNSATHLFDSLSSVWTIHDVTNMFLKSREGQSEVALDGSSKIGQ